MKKIVTYLLMVPKLLDLNQKILKFGDLVIASVNVINHMMLENI